MVFLKDYFDWMLKRHADEIELLMRFYKDMLNRAQSFFASILL